MAARRFSVGLALAIDAPLSNLDAQLRVQMLAEVRGLQRELAVPTIYFTHDPAEAMTMGERVAIMRNGRLQQVDTPERIYDRPANQFVAGFIGSPSMNLVNARIAGDDGDLTVSFGHYRLTVDDDAVAERGALLDYDGHDVILGIRPEDFEDAAFAPDGPPERTLDTVCILIEPCGSNVLVHFSVADSDFVARVHPRTAARAGEPLRLAVNTKRLHFFDPETGSAIDRSNDRHSRQRQLTRLQAHASASGGTGCRMDPGTRSRCRTAAPRAAR